MQGPSLFKKQAKKVEPILGIEDTEATEQALTRATQVYTPTKIVPREIDDIAQQLAQDLQDFVAQNNYRTIECDDPVNFAEASALTSSGLTGNIFNYAMMKQEVLDKSEMKTLWDIWYERIMLLGLIIGGPAAIIIVALAAFKYIYGH